MESQQKGGEHIAMECQQEENGRREKFWDTTTIFLNLMAMKSAILAFTKNLSNLAIHIQMDNKVVLSCLLKMKGTHSPDPLKISKSIWKYLLSHGIIITAEYLPSKSNVQFISFIEKKDRAQADWESQNASGSSNQKLHQSIFQIIIKHFGYPAVDLFSTRLCHQLPHNIARKPDAGNIATDAMQQCWNKMFPYAFLPFSLISRILKNIRQEKIEQMIS